MSENVDQSFQKPEMTSSNVFLNYQGRNILLYCHEEQRNQIKTFKKLES